MTAWSRAGLTTTIAVNLSTRVLIDKRFAADVRRILEIHGMPGEKLHFEITESAMLADPARAIEAITELNALGIRFSVDDFGIGFSSLSTLKQLPLDGLKIDRSFICHMTTSERVASIVRSTIHVAHDLGLDVIAEGVESTETLAAITQMGCDRVQGYAIAVPSPGATVLDWARSNGSA